MSEANVTEIKTLNGYPLADTKARADIATLSEEKVDVPTTTEITHFTKSDKGYTGYIDTSGIEQNTGSWIATNFIKLKGKAHIEGVFVNNSNISAVAFYDENKVFLSSVHAETTSLNFNFRVDMPAPEGAKFVRFSFFADGNDQQQATVTDSYNNQYALVTEAILNRPQELTNEQQTVARTNINAAEKTVEDVTTVITHAQLTNRGLLNPESGAVVDTGSFVCSDFIRLNEHPVITGYIREFTGCLSIAYYDQNKNFISGLGGVSNWVKLPEPYEIPQNAVYVRFAESTSGNSINITVTSKREVSDFVYVKDMDYNEIVENAAGNAFVNTSGGTESTGAWSISDYVRVNQSYSIDYKLYGTPSTNLIAFYDKNRTYINGIPGAETGLHENKNVVPPENAYYARYAVLNDDTTQYIRFSSKKIETAFIEIERLWDTNPLWGKIMAATGDSITATVHYRQYAGYAKMIAAKYMMTYESKAIWGATIAQGIEGSSGCILDTISEMREDADYIILSGGANDFYALSSGREQLGEVTIGYAATLDGTTFCGAVESMCKQAIERWPGKKILYVITHRMLDISHADLEEWVDTLIAILKKWGIPYVDLWHDMPSLMLPALKNLYTSMGNTEYNGTGDGLHPNEEGYWLYYVPRVEDKLKGI